MDTVAQLRADLQAERAARTHDVSALFEEIRVLRERAGFDSPSHLAATAAREERRMQSVPTEPPGDAYALDRAQRDEDAEAVS